jgi:PAS domain S-box-containing protein
MASPRVHILTRWLGWVLAALGLSGLVGWLLTHQGLSQPVPSFPAVSLLEALGILLMGLALVSGISGRRQGGTYGAAAIVGLGVIALARQLFAVGPELVVPRPGEPMTLIPLALPVSSALLFIFAGAGLLGLALPRPADRSRLAAGAFGAITGVLCLGILATRVLWRADVEGGLLLGSSFQLLLATLLLGLCLALITWSSYPETASTFWLPLTVCIACLVTAMFIWRSLITYEQEQIREKTRSAARSARIQIGRQIEAATAVLSRIARFSPAPWPRSRDWENSAIALTRDVGGLRALAWTDTSYIVRQIQPAAIDSEPLRADVEARLGADVRAEPASQWQVARHFTLSLPGTFGIALPTCDDRHCTGYVVGVFDAARMLAPVLSDSGSGFVYAVTGERRRVFPESGRVVPPAEWTDQSTVTTGRLIWDIATWPNSQTIGRLRSGLPDLLLLLGLLVSTLLPLTIRLGQMNFSRARLAERIRVNLALETATDGIWEWDVATGTAQRSASLWRHLGYDPGAMSGDPDPWAALIHPTDQPRVLNALSDHLSGLTPTFEARYRIRGLAGDWHWVIDRGRVVERSPTGHPRRVLGISADVTDRQRADEALAASERRFRACFDSAFQMQVLLDHEGRVLEANRAALEFARAELPVIRGRPLWELPAWGETGQVAAQIRSDVAEALGGRSVRRELDLSSKDEPLLLEVSLSPIHDGGGQVMQILVDGRDVTVRKRAEDVLREVESLTTMGRMAARVAHEINNPLAGIQNAFLLIKDAVPNDHPHRAYVGAVEREIARIAGVTRQLYETYRPEHNGAHGTSMASLVGDAVALLEQINRGSGVRIEVNLSGSPATVGLPEAILRQALYNLVQNAVEASPAGGVVEVAATVENHTFILRVSDRGPGIPAEIRERVFEPFFTTKSAGLRTGGMGLGLSLVGRSVQALGGHVEIQDRAGGGTEVVVRLPVPALAEEVHA